MTIFERVFGPLRQCSGRDALLFEGQRYSYPDLIAAIKVATEEFTGLGYTKGDRVLILLPNCPEFVVYYFAITNFGGVVVLADTKLNNELLGILEENHIESIVSNHEGISKINKICAETDSCRKLQFMNIEERRLKAQKACPGIVTSFREGPAMAPDDYALILYTSGSSGKPKGVINTHQTLVAALNNYSSTLPISDTDKLIAVTPFFHSYAMGSCMLAGLASGATLLPQETFQPRKVLKQISGEKATIFHGVPYMYTLLTQHYSSQEYSLESIRFCISAGAPLMAETARHFFEVTGKVIHQEYGSSETGTIAINLHDDLEINIKSVGNPLHGVQVRLTSQDETHTGIIQVKSPGHSVGYLGCPPFDRDWYETGDLGQIDDHNNIHILGRVKRLINIAGLKLNPVELETYLMQHEGIINVLVQGAKDEDFGEIVEALVVRRDENVGEDDIIKFCQGHFAAYKVPKRIHWVESLPKSGTGKTLF